MYSHIQSVFPGLGLNITLDGLKMFLEKLGENTQEEVLLCKISAGEMQLICFSSLLSLKNSFSLV